MYRTWSLRRREPLSRAALEALMLDLPEGVLRAKGFVYLAEDPDRRQVLQRVGRRWTLTAAGPWGEAERGTTLVFIGVWGTVVGGVKQEATRFASEPARARGSAKKAATRAA